MLSTNQIDDNDHRFVWLDYPSDEMTFNKRSRCDRLTLLTIHGTVLRAV